MKKKYEVKFYFVIDNHWECPWNEYSTSLNPRTSKLHQPKYCKFFGPRYKCDVSALDEPGYPKWCPITLIEEYDGK